MYAIYEISVFKCERIMIQTYLSMLSVFMLHISPIRRAHVSCYVRAPFPNGSQAQVWLGPLSTKFTSPGVRCGMRIPRLSRPSESSQFCRAEKMGGCPCFSLVNIGMTPRKQLSSCLFVGEGAESVVWWCSVLPIYPLQGFHIQIQTNPNHR